MLVRFYIADLIDCTSYVNERKIKLLKSKLESCTVSSCSRSGTLIGIVTSSFPACQASCELVFPLVVLTPKSPEFSLRSIPRFVAGRAKPIVTVVREPVQLQLEHLRTKQLRQA